VTGDGLADYIYVDSVTGGMWLWENGGWDLDAMNIIWKEVGPIGSGTGPGIGVRFADIDGDGRADYLMVSEDGSVDGYLNIGPTANGWLWVRQSTTAAGVDRPRQDIHFADLDGDGKADYIYVNRLTGAAQAWRNG
jgi:FG-GAP-like repeat